MTTLISWYGKQGDADCAYLIGDGRITAPQGPAGFAVLSDNYPKVIPISINYFADTKTGNEKSKHLSLGIAFSGLALAATASIETFRQICETISGPADKNPNLYQLATLLAEIHWHHRSTSNFASAFKCEFILVGICPVSNATQIFALRNRNEDQILSVEIIESNEMLVVGEQDSELARKISAIRSESESSVNEPMHLLYKLCQRGGTEVTGGSLSLGYMNPYFKNFATKIVADYCFDAQGNLLSDWTMNGFNVSRIKQIIPDFYSAGFAFSPFNFADRISELKAVSK